MEKVTTTTAKGLVLALIMIVISLAINFSGLQANSSIQWVIYLVFVAGIIFSILQFGKQTDYNSTFGNYFAHGFKVSAIVTVLMIIFLVVFIMLVPDFKEKALDEARKNMSGKNYTQDQMEKALDITRKFFTVFLIGGALLGYMVIGAIASLLGAAFTKKNPRPIEDINQIG